MKNNRLKRLPSSTDRLIMEAKFPKIIPAELFDFFTKPEKLALWWAPEAQIDPRSGGDYLLSWPAMNWHLRGVYLNFQSPTILEFTWNWDHEPKLPERTVKINFHKYGSGTRLKLFHGSYSDTAVDQADRQNHSDGWFHFFGQLRELE